MDYYATVAQDDALIARKLLTWFLVKARRLTGEGNLQPLAYGHFMKDDFKIHLSDSYMSSDRQTHKVH